MILLLVQTSRYQPDTSKHCMTRNSFVFLLSYPRWRVVTHYVMDKGNAKCTQLHRGEADRGADS